MTLKSRLVALEEQAEQEAEAKRADLERRRERLLAFLEETPKVIEPHIPVCDAAMEEAGITDPEEGLARFKAGTLRPPPGVPVHIFDRFLRYWALTDIIRAKMPEWQERQRQQEQGERHEPRQTT